MRTILKNNVVTTVKNGNVRRVYQRCFDALLFARTAFQKNVLVP